jgi:hypothetical protein
LLRLPERFPNRNRLWDQTELKEAIGNALLDRDDVIGDRAHSERRAIGGDTAN